MADSQAVSLPKFSLHFLSPYPSKLKVQPIVALISLTYSVALQLLKNLGRLTYGMFLKLFRYFVGLIGQGISPSQGLYLHRTTQHRKTRTDIHALSGIRTHDSSIRAIKTHAPDRAATVTGPSYHNPNNNVLYLVCQEIGN
jgi:hypothetical protein